MATKNCSQDAHLNARKHSRPVPASTLPYRTMWAVAEWFIMVATGTRHCWRLPSVSCTCTRKQSCVSAQGKGGTHVGRCRVVHKLLCMHCLCAGEGSPPWRRSTKGCMPTGTSPQKPAPALCAQGKPQAALAAPARLPGIRLAHAALGEHRLNFQPRCVC